MYVFRRRVIGNVIDEKHETSVHSRLMDKAFRPVLNRPYRTAQYETRIKPHDEAHIMLIGIRHDLNVDDEFTVDLEFEKSAPMAVDVVVLEP